MARGAKKESTPQRSRGRSQWASLLSSRRTILLLLFGATGILGLPLLWMSQVFTLSEKIVWTVVNTAYTLLLVGLAVGVCYWCYLQIQQSAGI